jgi:hypothetical protein
MILSRLLTVQSAAVDGMKVGRAIIAALTGSSSSDGVSASQKAKRSDRDDDSGDYNESNQKKSSFQRVMY